MRLKFADKLFIFAVLKRLLDIKEKMNPVLF